MIDVVGLTSSRYLTLSLVIYGLLWASLAVADSRLHGSWGSYKTRGKVCSAQIEKIVYYFGPNGEYEIDSRMNRPFGVRKETAKGRYEVSNGTITGFVNDVTVGPFPYRFEGKDLVISQSNPPCEIFLSRDQDE